MTHAILCIGSVLWDVIGRTNIEMHIGSDQPGRISRLPGGVAMNIAMTFSRFGLKPALITAIGHDHEGDELMFRAREMGMVTEYVYRSPDLPTDRYMAIEGPAGLVAALADAHSLEAAGDKILRPLSDGSLAAPYRGAVALDGNLTLDLLAHVAQSPLLAQADLRVAPASPGKALRLSPFVQSGRGTLYVNLEEAGLLREAPFESSADAAAGLLARGAARAVVTDGGNPATVGQSDALITMTPPQVHVARVTGAGDTFMAAHIAAELAGCDADHALSDALAAAALYVSGETKI